MAPLLPSVETDRDAVSCEVGPELPVAAIPYDRQPKSGARFPTACWANFRSKFIKIGRAASHLGKLLRRETLPEDGRGLTWSYPIDARSGVL
jgi:hypothetical protein